MLGGELGTIKPVEGGGVERCKNEAAMTEEARLSIARARAREKERQRERERE